MTINDQFVSTGGSGNRKNNPSSGNPSHHDSKHAGRGKQHLYSAISSRTIQGNSRVHSSDANRFQNVPLDKFVGEIFSLCRDQHGCRYLQKKLEENNPQYLDIIYSETKDRFVELMTDPFGNYLCQKLIYYTDEDQLTVIVKNCVPHLIPIAFNQYGTRALQKMIESLKSPYQVSLIINALKGSVVELIRDLNGNHVIQKCLNCLSHEQAQFIYDVVGKNCVVVGTHRHGCCVLQRCIDHASPEQKDQLVAVIVRNALSLVQDQFGNYVTQYVLDLGLSKYINPLIEEFLGHICEMSLQKFSSNVMEKCIRISEPSQRSAIIREILVAEKLDQLLRDSYGNYVVQTAIDSADLSLRAELIDTIKPLLPVIRNTPYGRRIYSKIGGLPPQPAASGMDSSTRIKKQAITPEPEHFGILNSY
ncbi:hypothetical protein CANCADRAFT_22238 [Tortispora caseinolytica NRRL Y-17796]|uniref:PUM-HD domain-containing protein n=1 Tax=Tortispora caseinolytica NRRL Y-17796 TaxID=767744 RepID=A0A1E4TJ99_9ASCO|nr:hypothetical protein CANCADRAFT_22238 [Tortispora caseinolytica NRRL Y-17796]